MYCISPSFVLGFHGCEREIGERVLAGEATLLDSTNDYDWLGRGAYFWENNPQRALSFATNAQKRSSIKNPFVIGAVIDLGRCLDFTTESALREIRQTYLWLEAASKEKGGQPLRKNKPYLRRLDCQVIDALHTFREFTEAPAYDSVRSPFWEGERLYAGTDFMHETHVQLAIRNVKSIKGYFRVLDLAGKPVEFVRSE
jgi:hypothetical protein